ncbi:MAG: hypothetical protein E6767_10050 [Dysgonomonas sp.]|nr:hypothetical protein [Dysgonomonas sp.]
MFSNKEFYLKNSINSCVLTPDNLGVRIIMLKRESNHLAQEENSTHLFVPSSKHFLMLNLFAYTYVCMCMYTYMRAQILSNNFFKSKYPNLFFSDNNINLLYSYGGQKRYPQVSSAFVGFKVLLVASALLISICCETGLHSLLTATGSNL